MIYYYSSSFVNVNDWIKHAEVVAARLYGNVVHAVLYQPNSIPVGRVRLERSYNKYEHTSPDDVESLAVSKSHNNILPRIVHPPMNYHVCH